MSAEDKQDAMEFITNFKKLDHGDQRYVQGWVDAKAASQQEKREEKKGGVRIWDGSTRITGIPSSS